MTADQTTLYVADFSRIRKITLGTTLATTMETTIAGTSSTGFADGNGDEAKFNNVYGMALNSDETILYVADLKNNRIRKIVIGNDKTSTQVTTVAGDGTEATLNGIGTAAKIHYPVGIALTKDNGTLYFTGQDCSIRKINMATTEVTTVVCSGIDGFIDGIGSAAETSGSERNCD